MNELVDILDSYLNSNAGLREIAEWLAGVVWDDPELTKDDQEVYGLFELLVTEIAEGMRDEAELRTEAEQFLAEMAKPAFR